MQTLRYAGGAASLRGCRFAQGEKQVDGVKEHDDVSVFLSFTP
jgi:hypothetical protein